jgi:hypothetical protein
VPGEAERATGEQVTAEQLGQVVSAEQPNKDVPLTQLGVGRANAYRQRASGKEGRVHPVISC